MGSTITRYGLSLKLDCDNAAFEGTDRAREVARILRTLADKIEGRSPDFTRQINTGQRTEGVLWDINGNSCGSWEAKPRRIRI